MFKKMLLPILTLLLVFNLNTQAEWRKNITMLMVPREAKTLQIAQDISRRYPVLIVCYQQQKEAINLHAWNGEGWVAISTGDYVNGTFFSQPPTHTIFVENGTDPIPKILIPDGTWCNSGNRLTSDDPRTIIHLLGRYFDFPYRYWVQFAKRYHYTVAEINPALLNIHRIQRMDRSLFPKGTTRDKAADLNQWKILTITPPPPVKPILTDEKPEPVLPVEIPAEEPEKTPESIPMDIPMDNPTENPAESLPEIPVNPETNELGISSEDALEFQQIVEALDADGILPVSEEISTAKTNDIPIEMPRDPFSIENIPPAEIILTP